MNIMYSDLSIEEMESRKEKKYTINLNGWRN